MNSLSSGVLRIPSEGVAKVSDVFYSAYSVTESGNDPHYYCQKRLAASKTTIVNVSFVILSSGRFILEFSCVDPQAQGCVVGYEANIEYSLY